MDINLVNLMWNELQGRMTGESSDSHDDGPLRERDNTTGLDKAIEKIVDALNGRVNGNDVTRYLGVVDGLITDWPVVKRAFGYFDKRRQWDNGPT